MPRFIVKLADDKYVMWSTVVDAPVSLIMTRAEANEYLINTYRDGAAERAHGDLALADHGGTGSTRYMLDDVIAGNRAGPGETELTLEQILKRFRPIEVSGDRSDD